MKLIFVCGMLLLFLSGCKQTESFFTYQTEANGNQVAYIDLNKVTDSVPVTLSSLITDIRLVALETQDSCLLGYAGYVVGNKYIVSASNRDGKILLFDANGKYLRTLAYYGKGPGEFLWIARICFDRDENTLYALDSHQRRLHSWTLPDGTYQAIPLAQDGLSYTFLMPDDTTVILGNGKNKNTPYIVYTQNLSGQFIQGFANAKKENDAMTRFSNTLFQSEGEVYYLPHGCDSLYLYTGGDLVLKYAFPLPQQHIFTLLGFQQRCMLYSLFNITKIEALETSYGKQMSINGNTSFYLVDPRAEQVTLCNPWINDYLGLPLSAQDIAFQENGQYFIVYSASSLLEEIPKALKDKNLAPEVRRRLEELQENVHEEDNPILLIGKAKDHFSPGSTVP